MIRSPRRPFGFTATTRSGRRPHFGPRLEVLEDRLPPGDLLLAGLLGSAWLGASLAEPNVGAWAAEPASAEALSAGRKARPSSAFAAADDGPSASAFPVVPLRIAGQPAEVRPEVGSAAHSEIGGAAAAALTRPGGDLWPFASTLDIAQGGVRTAGGAHAPDSAAGLGGPAQAGPGDGPGAPVVAVAPGSGGAPVSASAVLPAAATGGPAESMSRLAGILTATLGGPAPAAHQDAPAVHATFDLSTRAAADFPSDRFTVADPTQNTGRRVNLPLPDPNTNPSDYQDTLVLNELDGFNVQPRLSIPFNGPIDVNTVTSNTVFLVRMGDTLNPQDHGGQVVGINQVVWDPLSNTLHVESNDLLDQHTRYALIVTNGVHDTQGNPVQASEDFTRFRHDLNFGQTKDPVLKDYRKELLDAMAAARKVGVPESDIVTASVFTTQSVTATLEKIRDQILAAAATKAPRADFNVGLNGERTVFNQDELTNIVVKQQTTVGAAPVLTAFKPLDLLRAIPGKPDVVGKVVYGKYLSPDYEVHPSAAHRAAGEPGEYIPAVPTRTGTPAVQGYNDIYFTLYLPSGTPPANGWPVAILGHGGSGNKDGTFGVGVGAAKMAENGIATIGINAVGHGLGPGSTLTVTQSGSSTVTLPAGGRGIDKNGDGIIGNTEGIDATLARAIISGRDGRIQTAADQMQLVRVIEAGMDVAGDGVADLDPSRIYFIGASLSSSHGAPFLAVEPDVKAGVLNTVGGPAIEIRRLRGTGATGGGESGRPGLGADLAARVPSLLNTPGVTKLGGLTIPPTSPTSYFNENMPLRDGVPLTVGLTDGKTYTIKSPMYNTVDGTKDGPPVAGAMAIQELFDNREWAYQPGSAVAYAPYLGKDPLPGVPAKSIIVQFARGDQTIENPTTTAFLRAGDLADRATLYRHDLAYADNLQNPLNPPMLKNPHTFLGLITSLTTTNPTSRAIAFAAQQQIATFFASDGTTIIQPPDVRKEYFEVGMTESELPEDFGYIL